MTPMQALAPRSKTFSAAIVTADGWIHISGQIGSDADGRATGDCGRQARRCFEKIDALLAQAGADRTRVVKLTAYLVNAADYAAYAAAKADWVGDPAPAGTAVIVEGLLVPGALIEIEAVARAP